MSRPRSFDWDEARARRAAGESAADLAREYGVTTKAIWHATCAPEVRARELSRKRSYQRSGLCEICGESCVAAHVAGKAKHNPDGRELCYRCRSAEMTARVRRDDDGAPVEVRCATCKRWLPLSAFPSGSANVTTTAGIHSQCRGCNTVARQNYRERHKVPCAICGDPCLPPAEKRTHGVPYPRCRPCYVEGRTPTEVAA